MNLPNLTSYNLTELWNSKSLLPLVSLFNPFSIIGCHTLFQGLFPNAKCQHLDSQAISYYWQSPNNTSSLSLVFQETYIATTWLQAIKEVLWKNFLRQQHWGQKCIRQFTWLDLLVRVKTLSHVHSDNKSETLNVKKSLKEGSLGPW